MAKDEGDIKARFRSNAVKLREVDLPGIGKVFVKQLTLGQANEIRARADDDEDDKYQGARYAALIICDQAGNRIFDPDNKEDLELLASQPLELGGQLSAKAEGTDKAGN